MSALERFLMPRIGHRVRVIGNSHPTHYFSIGDVVTLAYVDPDGKRFEAKDASGLTQIVNPVDVERT